MPAPAGTSTFSSGLTFRVSACAGQKASQWPQATQMPAFSSGTPGRVSSSAAPTIAVGQTAEQTPQRVQRELPGVNAKMLTRQLRELEGDGVVRRTVYPEVPPRVEYAVTEFGRTLLPIMEALCAWGTQYLGIDDAAAPGCPAKVGREKA